MYIIWLWLGKLIIVVTRLFGGGGSSLAGLIIEKVDSNFLKKAVLLLKDGSIIITGTNGKTTTSRMVSQILISRGKAVLANKAGSNMLRGVITAVVEQSSIFGRPKGDVGVFEVDEAYVPIVSKILKPKVLVVLNLHRDQLDRYGELDAIAKVVGRGIKYAKKVILNADDPLVAALAKGYSSKSFYFGAVSRIAKQVPYDASLYGLSDEADSVKARADLLLTKVNNNTFARELTVLTNNITYRLKLKLPGLYNAYNALASLLTTQVLGIPITDGIAALAQVRTAYGRSESVRIDGKNFYLLLVKNPAGFNQIIQTFLAKQKSQRVLFIVNDNIADGRDVSWLWDVDLELLAGKRHQVLCSGIRGYDIALRLKYAGVRADTNLNLKKALNQFITETQTGSTGYIIPTYTAMLTARKLLAKKTKLGKVWQ